MEVNKDEALRCLDIARRHLNIGNYASARKFGGKSISLYPTPEAKAFLARVDKEEDNSGATPSSSTDASTPSSTKSSPNPGSGSASSFASGSATASASGSSTTRPNSVPPRPRSTPVDHKPVEREYTPEQVAAVKKIRSSGGDFYKVLGISKDASDSDIKKAYRKLALQMHPDKNGAPGADEAFKIVSKAFTVLSDPQKRAIFDQHGPEDGRSSGVNYDRASPAGHGFSGMHGMNGFGGEEISPEELFNMFFGGGNFGGSFHSATFAGPGFGTRQFRTRTQQTQHRQHRQNPQQQAGGGGGTSGLSSLIQILPLILLFIMSMASSFFSDDSSSSSPGGAASGPQFSLGSHGSLRSARFTDAHNVPYFVNERDFRNWFTIPGQDPVNGAKVRQSLSQYEDRVESFYLRTMRERCTDERKRKEIAHNRAMGFFGPNEKMWKAAQRMTTPSCDEIRDKFNINL
ncbi:hypothetical protein BGZ50_004603 [Haplosporangium sp. Z 11]|nr:hypothetical protein BGZ50_004603 [Haplosporangium sp. Z 11]